MCQQCAFVQAALHSLGLMLTQGYGCVRAGIMCHDDLIPFLIRLGMRKRRQTILLQPIVVILVIVDSLQFTVDFIALVNVFNELIGYFHDFFRSGLRFCFVGYSGCAFPARSIRSLFVKNLRFPLVKGIGEQIQGIHPLSLVQSRFSKIRDVCPTTDNKLVQQRFIAHVSTGYAQHTLGKIIDVLHRNPRRSQPIADITKAYSFRLNAHQILHVFLIIRIVFSSRTGFLQLLTDIAG